MMKKMMKKCSTDQRFIRKRNTSSKIGTLAKDILALKFERNYEPPKEDGALMILCHEEMRLRRSINISRHARKKKMLTNFYAIQGQRRAVVGLKNPGRLILIDFLFSFLNPKISEGLKSPHARKKKMLTNFYAIQGQRRAVVRGKVEKTIAPS